MEHYISYFCCKVAFRNCSFEESQLNYPQFRWFFSGLTVFMCPINCCCKLNNHQYCKPNLTLVQKEALHYLFCIYT